MVVLHLAHKSSLAKYSSPVRLMMWSCWIIRNRFIILNALKWKNYHFLKRFNSILLNKRLTNSKEMFPKSSQLQPINGKNFSMHDNACKVRAFRVFTEYLLGRSNTTIIYDCYPAVSNTLPVALKDLDGNSITRNSYNMRAGIDQ